MAKDKPSEKFVVDERAAVVGPEPSVAPVATAARRVVARRVTVAIDGKLVTFGEGHEVDAAFAQRLAALGVAFREG